MASPKAPTFIGYAREDQNFVLRLAVELKRAGARVWLDQFEITPGQHWETEVQRALDACDEMVIILSTAALDSRHVMNEVSYALDEGKIVIPVILQECKVPLGLRGRHYVDFRTDYEAGFKRLLNTLTMGGAGERVNESHPEFKPPQDAAKTTEAERIEPERTEAERWVGVERIEQERTEAERMVEVDRIEQGQAEAERRAEAERIAQERAEDGGEAEAEQADREEIESEKKAPQAEKIDPASASLTLIFAGEQPDNVFHEDFRRMFEQTTIAQVATPLVVSTLLFAPFFADYSLGGIFSRYNFWITMYFLPVAVLVVHTFAVSALCATARISMISFFSLNFYKRHPILTNLAVGGLASLMLLIINTLAFVTYIVIFNDDNWSNAFAHIVFGFVLDSVFHLIIHILVNSVFFVASAALSIWLFGAIVTTAWSGKSWIQVATAIVAGSLVSGYRLAVSREPSWHQ